MTFAVSDSIRRRLASACSRGVLQQSLVNEMLNGAFERRLVPVPGSSKVTHVYGETRLQARSFSNLKRRLVAVGFVFVMVRVNHETALIAMTFPEGR